MVVTMAVAGSNAPIIIKRKKVVQGGGHHGGAWKVAYADFVTAMMAFFLLMWLLNATTEQQRKGVADYFAPTIPINRISGGGDGSFGGDSIFSEDTLAHNGTGASPRHSGSDVGSFPQTDASQRAAEADTAALQSVDEALMGRTGEAYLSELDQRHIITRLTDEGLVVEIFDVPEHPLFQEKTATPTRTLIEIADAIARSFAIVSNKIAISGHTASRPIVLINSDVWEVSTERASVMRTLLESHGVSEDRFRRQTGEADRRQASDDPFSPRNNRLEIVLLRGDICQGLC